MSFPDLQHPGHSLIPDTLPTESFTSGAVGTERIWQTYYGPECGRPTVAMINSKSGAIFSTYIPRDSLDTAAFEAWVGARHSRSADNTVSIAHQVATAGVDTGGKLRYFLGIGHTSPADMAKIPIGLDNIPMHLAMLIFLISAEHAGQEKSTRFQQEFLEKPLDSLSAYLPDQIPAKAIEQLESHYQQLGVLALQSYTAAKEMVIESFRNYYGVTDSSGAAHNALISRSLDCARLFLLLGQKTGMTFVASAREFSRIISVLKAYPGVYYPELAQSLEDFLAPAPQVQSRTGYGGDAAELIRHTDPDPTFSNNLSILKDYLEKETSLLELIPTPKFHGAVTQEVSLLPYRYYPGDRLAAQCILSLYPDIHPYSLLEWLCEQDSETKKRIGQIIFQDVSPIRQLPRMAATTNMTLVFNSSIAVARDLARHRGGGGRFEPIPTFNGVPTNYQTARNLVNNGYVLPIHLSAAPEFADIQDKFDQLFKQYYQGVLSFLESCRSILGEEVDYGFILNLLPLGHKIPLWMHLHPAQANYMPELRVRPGGDNSYRVLADEANRLVSTTEDEIMHALRFPIERRPQILHREEFLNRS